LTEHSASSVAKWTASLTSGKPKGGRATGKSVMARNVNMELDKIKARIDKYYKEIVDRDNFVTAEKVKNAFLGLEYRQHTLMTMFAQWNEEYKKMYDGGSAIESLAAQVPGRL
jgi:hypothetical protein